MSKFNVKYIEKRDPDTWQDQLGTDSYQEAKEAARELKQSDNILEVKVVTESTLFVIDEDGYEYER